MFSQRLAWDISPNPVSRLLADKRAVGADILDLTESNPTHAGLAYPESLLAGLSDPKGLSYDPDPRGLISAREEVARYYRERGSEIPPERIMLTASTSEAYAYLFKLLADPGDEVLVPRPSYPLFEYLGALESVRLVHYSLRYDGAWHVDFESIEKMLTPRTRAVAVVNPNNPTGSYLANDELKQLETLCAARDIAILSDEVFYDYRWGGAPVSRSAPCALTFRMSGLSKIAGLPQLKLGWIAVSGPGSQAACERLEWIADTYLSVGTPVQLALPGLLKVHPGISRRVQENWAWLIDAARSSALTVLNSDGGWYAVVQVPRTRTEEEWVLTLLQDHNVLVQPGFFFDFESEAFLILSLLTETARFREGVRRLLGIL